MSTSAGFDELDVVDLAQADPAHAIDRANDVIDDPAWGERDRVLALWARGTARRELADVVGAEGDLTAAAQLAMPIDAVLRARVLLTLALVVMYRGQPNRALDLLRECDGILEGEERGRMLLQRGLIRHRSGSFVDARADYDEALEILRNDEISIVRLFLNLAVLDVYEGQPAAAVDRLVAARDRADAAGQKLLAASAEHNLGFTRAALGDVVDALEHYDAAERRYRELGDADGRLAVLAADRASTLLGANVLEAAEVDAAEAMEVLERVDLQVEFAEAALLAARIRFARGDAEGAATAVAKARAVFAATDRTAWMPLIRMLEVRIDALAASRDAAVIASEAEAAAIELRRHRWHREADAGFLLAGRLYLTAERIDDARHVLASVDQARDRTSPLERAARHLAHGLIAEADGDLGRARRAVSAGLASLWVGRLTVGHYELRAHAVSHAADLGRLGARLAIAGSRGREFIRRVEASRMISSVAPGVRPPRSEAIAQLLVELRVVTTRLREVGYESEDGRELARAQRQLERSIADVSRRQRGSEPGGETALADVLGRLGTRSLLFFYELDGDLWAATVAGGRASIRACGSAATAARASTDQHFGLNRLQRTTLSAPSELASRDVVRDGGAVLRAALPDQVLRSPEPLVVVPSEATASVCWSAVPELSPTSVSVTASLFAWSDAEARRSNGRSASVLLVAGPDLANAETEVDAIRARSGWATADRADGTEHLIERIAHCDVAHLACHGTFRSDNPLFSSLRLADGDLTLYDLERCERLPHTIVMSACNAAQHAVLDGGALLGMASALVQLGVSSIIAPLTPVNDERSVELMVRLHTHLAAGLPPAEALARVNRAADDDFDPTAAPFVCFGS